MPSGKADAWAFEAAADGSDMLVVALILKNTLSRLDTEEGEKRAVQRESEKGVIKEPKSRGQGRGPGGGGRWRGEGSERVRSSFLFCVVEGVCDRQAGLLYIKMPRRGGV